MKLDRFLIKIQTLQKKTLNIFKHLSFLITQDLKKKTTVEGNYQAIEDAVFKLNMLPMKHNFNGTFSSNSEYLSLINLARVRQITAEEQFNRNEISSWISKKKLIGIEKEINNYKSALIL